MRIDRNDNYRDLFISVHVLLPDYHYNHAIHSRANYLRNALMDHGNKSWFPIQGFEIPGEAKAEVKTKLKSTVCKLGEL